MYLVLIRSQMKKVPEYRILRTKGKIVEKAALQNGATVKPVVSSLISVGVAFCRIEHLPCENDILRYINDHRPSKAVFRGGKGVPLLMLHVGSVERFWGSLHSVYSSALTWP